MNRPRRPWLWAFLAISIAALCLASGVYQIAPALAVVACLLALTVYRPRREAAAMYRPPAMPPLPAPPHRYRLHVYDGQYEVLRDRRHLVELDLGGPGVDAALSRHLSALTMQAYAAGEPMQYPRLEVRDPDTGVLLMDWTGV